MEGHEPIRRILSLDGGGLYGLTSALWLKQLCEGDPGFLGPGNVDLFAGCSAGALNSLLLAKEPDPRKFLLAGGLDAFWRLPGTFSNSNPVTALLSLYQITAWLGVEDFRQVLRNLFGDMTLGDLPHRVLITSFNWTGARTAGSGAGPAWPPGCGPCDPWNPWTYLDPWSWWAAMGGQVSGYPAPASPADYLGGVGQNVRGWRPKFFKNFPESEPDRQLRVVDVAYAAATPPGLRAVLDGFGDGGTFNACPCADALAAAVANERQANDLESDAAMTPERLTADFDLVRNVLCSLRLLSLGVGATKPAYWLKFFDTSFTQFNVYPTNPLVGNWYPPNVSVGLDGPTEDAIYISRQLLSANFHRLNPGILEVPTLVACLWARFPSARWWLTQQIYAAVETPASKAAVKDALAFLQGRWYDDVPNDQEKTWSAGAEQ
jgi:hypothetical protein